MKKSILVVVMLVCIMAFNSFAQAVTMDFVIVGNAGNVGEWTGESYGGYGPDRMFGAVGYDYSIGKYEVTTGQYVEFLNAVATADTYGLYNTMMADIQWNVCGCNIQRSGSEGSYTYSVAVDWANRPVNYVSWYDSIRFANWIHNGQPIGLQDATTTEDGAYTLTGLTSIATGDHPIHGANGRNAGAKVWLPSEDEWYKAAYHKNDGVTGNYFDYPTSSDSFPSNELVEPIDPGNNATWYDEIYTIGSPYYRTEVGAHENSDSPYGTFDMGGNVYERNEAIADSFRGIRGSSWGNSFGDGMNSSHWNYEDPLDEDTLRGFRLASVYSCEYVLVGDMNDDCKVDFCDFAELTSVWQIFYDMTDLAEMVTNWLIDCDLTPGNSACVPK